MTTLLTAGARSEVEARPEGDDLWMQPADLLAATGWELKPEGFCQGDTCVPVPPAKADRLVEPGGWVNAAELWRHMGHPLVHTSDGSHWYLGESAEVRRRQLRSVEAPDFTLPDKDGNLFSLSDFRGRKVFLASWASW